MIPIIIRSRRRSHGYISEDDEKRLEKEMNDFAWDMATILVFINIAMVIIAFIIWLVRHGPI